MTENNALNSVVQEIVERMKGLDRHLFIGISEGEMSEKLIAFAEDQGETWLARVDEKTIFFIIDKKVEMLSDQFPIAQAHGLYMKRGTPSDIIDAKSVSIFEKYFITIQTLFSIPERKFNIDERVQCHGQFGVVTDAVWGYHNRGEKYCWKYKVTWELEGPGLSIMYLPEGYLQKEDEVLQAYNA